MYCTLADVHQYLNIPTATTTDDALINILISAAQARIESVTKRKFEATADSDRYFDAVRDIENNALVFDADISHITSIIDNSVTVPAADYITDPRNQTPYQSVKPKYNAAFAWNYTNAPEDAIVVTGYWACMFRKPITAIARATSFVTATMPETGGLTIGSKIHCAGVADNAFNGGFFLTAVTDTTVTWAQSAANDTDTTGTLLFTPPDIRQACIRLIAWLYRQKDNQMGDQDRPIITEGGAVIMPTTLPGDVQAILREWVKIR